MAADAPPGTVGGFDSVHARVAAGDEWVTVRRLRHAGVPVAPNEVFEPADVLGSENGNGGSSGGTPLSNESTNLTKPPLSATR